MIKQAINIFLITVLILITVVIRKSSESSFTYIFRLLKLQNRLL